MNAREIFVVATARTAIGTFGGALKDVPNTQLATTAVKAALERSGVAPDAIGHVVIGNVIPTDPKDAYLSRVAAIDAGVPIETPAFNVNRLWAPGHCLGGAGYCAGRLRDRHRRGLGVDEPRAIHRHFGTLWCPHG